MATQFDALAVKSLNNAPGRRRFVFKTFCQRINDIEIDVYKSLEPLKAEPSKGSSFFLDCLVECRELNTAEDFISFYEEMLPLVQTLPQIILQKELIFVKLLSRLQMTGRLSLEPVLRLIAALSRDLLEDFLPFLQRITDSLASLLKSGADREPDIVEQIFTSWSFIMMYLQKYLTRDVVNFLKVTVKLRYYHKDYIQEFMAESVSFLFRNAPLEQLKKGIRMVIFEVAKKPLPIRKTGVSALLWYTVRGTGSRLHSRADKVLGELVGKSLFGIGDKVMEGSGTVLEVLVATFQRMCEELDSRELHIMWECLHQKIEKTINLVKGESKVLSMPLTYLDWLLSLLLSTLQSGYAQKVSDYEKMISLIKLLVQNFISRSLNVEMVEVGTCPRIKTVEVVDKILQLIICIPDRLYYSDDNNISVQLRASLEAVFDLPNTSLLTFMKDFLLKDPCILHIFRSSIISALNELLKTSEEESVRMLLIFCEKLQVQSSSFFCEISNEKLSNIQHHITKAIEDWIGKSGKFSENVVPKSSYAQLWGFLHCYPYVADAPVLLMGLVDKLDGWLLTPESEFPTSMGQCLIATALASYHKVLSRTSKGLQESDVSRFLDISKKYKLSSQILSSVADALDHTYGSPVEAETGCKIWHPELVASKLVDALDVFAENLYHSNKGVRLSTLRILSHYESLDHGGYVDERTVKTDARHIVNGDFNVVQLLLSIEATPLSIASSRKIVLLISKIQMLISASRICDRYIPFILNGIVGILHNRFSYLWESAIECLAVLIGQYSGVLWEKYLQCLHHCMSAFFSPQDQSGIGDTDLSPGDLNVASDLAVRFKAYVDPLLDSTPPMTVLASLIRVLQKISSIAESRSRHLVPLFLRFLGYDADDLVRVESYNSQICKGKHWKGILKEWLHLFSLMANPKSFYRGQFLKEVLLERLLDDNDAELQMKALDCLLKWKDDYLHPYGQHLKNLINTRTLREELTTWGLLPASGHIDVGHRRYLVPVVIRILVPKVRKLKSLSSRKNTSVFHRKAVLGFLAQLDADELPLFFSLLMKPLQASPQEVDEKSAISPENTVTSSDILKHFTARNIKCLSWKKLNGFLHVVEELMAVFDDMRISQFLDLLMMCVVRILKSCTLTLDTKLGRATSKDELIGGEDNMVLGESTVKQSKELRSQCLKVISYAINKYEDHDFGGDFWDLFFTSVKPLIAGFKQEGSSSEKPSSLFSCFQAMSRNHKSVLLLLREKNLIPDIFSMLTVTTASEAILSSVFKFVENLLILDIELGDENYSIRSILIDHLDILVCCMHFLFTHSTAAKRKMMRHPGLQELVIFKLLSKYVTERSAAKKFVDILLPILTKKSQNSDVCMETLQIIRPVVSVIGNENCKEILNSLSQLLICSDRAIRGSICDVLDALAENDCSLVDVAKLIRELNAAPAMEIDGLDYETITSAYDKVDFYTVREEHAILILSHAIHDLSSDELILRQSAFGLLLCFVEFSGRVLDGKVDQGHEFYSEAWIQHAVNNFILKYMGNAMNQEGPAQKVWIDLLRELVVKLPTIPHFKSYQALCSEDVEQDFFFNILHLQKHRRARALSRFRNLVSSGDFSEVIMNKVLVPLFFNMLFSIQDGKGEHVRSACLEALASVSSCLKWKSYFALLLRCFKEISLKPDKRKILLRLICAILDQFHFSETCPPHDSNQSAMDTQHADITKMNSSTEPNRCASSDELNYIQTCLQMNLLPKIQKMLTSDSEGVNVNVSLVALKVLKLLPGDILQIQLPSIVHRISNFLKNRLESVRDEARSALATCLKELGLEYLQFIVKVLRGTLKRGFELHVLGYTLNFILTKLLLNPIKGKLDYCLEDLLSVAGNDILGDVSKEKEVDKIASKMKETRKQKSYETLKLIAQNITFKTHALKLLSPVIVHLQKQLNPEMKRRLERMLENIAAGIQSNLSVNQTELFVFIYGLIKDGIIDEHHGSENNAHAMASRGLQAEGLIMPKNTEKLIDVDPRYAHLITGFALGLLQCYMKNMKMNKKDEEMLSLLDPFVSLLCDCLDSKYENILCAAIKCLTPLVRLPLPSLESLADKIKNSLLVIVQSSFNSSSPLMDSCISLLIGLLRSTRVTLSTYQLQSLIQFPLFVDLEKNPSFLALSLLKAIVNRKLVVPEIYDLVKQVAEIMVKSQVEPVRKKCSQILLQFLLDYKLSEKRLQQHLDFLLAHLKEGYEYSAGKEAVLEMLHAIIIKFPISILDEQSQTVFVHLVLRLANDPDNKVRSMICAVIKLLIGRVSPGSVQAILEYSLSWYLSGKQQLHCAGAQVLGLLIEVIKTGFQKNINRVLPVMKKILQSSVVDSQLESSDDARGPCWKEAYYTLIMLEKLLHQFPELIFNHDLEDIWKTVCELLLHPHLWLRNISNRLLGSYFAAVSHRGINEVLLQSYFLVTPSRLFSIAASLCCQLKVPQIDDAAGTLITQNLLFSICGLHSFVIQDHNENPQKFWTTVQPEDKARLAKLFQLLDSGEGWSKFASLTFNIRDVENSVVFYLLKKLGKISLEVEAIQMKIVFSCFKAIAPKFFDRREVASSVDKNYAYQILLPLYKVCEGYVGKVVSDDVKQLAQDVLESVRDAMGMKNFVQVYSEIRKNLQVKRDKRKREEKHMAVKDQVGYAQRKRRIAVKNQANKKRRIMTMKIGRWMR